MSLIAEANKLAVIEAVAGKVLKPQAGIDIQPLIDALMEFLMQLLSDCPVNDIRRAAEQSAKRPLIRMFWRIRLGFRIPDEVKRANRDAAEDLLAAGAELSAAQWDALGA